MTQTHNPIRCFEGNAKPHEAFWILRDATEVSEPEIELYGYISEYSWFEDEITPKMFKDDLYRVGGNGPVTIRLNSYGGDVIAASLINGIIRDYPGKVTVQIDGVAASAATVVAIAGDEVRIQETGYFMVHDPSYVFFLAQLNIEKMTRMADSLKAVKEGIVNAYETKTGLSRARLSKLMSDETWMDANKALDLGFVDQVIRSESKKKLEIPQNAAVVNALLNFENVPPAVMQALQSVEEPEVVESSAPADTGDEEEELREKRELREREAQELRDRVGLILRKEPKHD